ncbi:hypothetical protein ACFE04_015324 [Oxalis oulophora]
MEIGGRRVSRGMLPLLALHTVTEYYRLPWKPPVTAGLIAANTLIYLRPSFIRPFIPSINQVWFNPHLIIKYMDMKRFFLSPFYHLGESHLVYNMISLLWKGVQLETSMGSAKFASMTVTLLAMSQGITLLLAKSLLLAFDYEKPFYNEYAVGFSGVLFALKVVLNSQSDRYTNVHGIIVPSRYAAWAELALVQILVPGVSFLGHLGGILAGMLYLKLNDGSSGSDPVSSIIKGVTGVLSLPLRLARNVFGSHQRRVSGRGRVGGSERGRTTSSIWRCSACTFDNSGLLSVCEICGTSRNGDANGLSAHRSSSRYSDDLSLEELRQRRMERFGL